MMSILVFFFTHTLFLVANNRKGLDRRHADYFEGSDSVTVKGRLRVNFVLWQALLTVSHAVLMSLWKVTRFRSITPYGCLELGINSPFN